MTQNDLIAICLRCDRRDGAACRENGRTIFTNTARLGCPLEKFGKPEFDPGSPAAPLPVDTAALWRELHGRAFLPELDLSKEPAWVTNDWTPRIPNFGCKCREEWATILAAYPPRFGNRDEYFSWGVTAHNMVNIKLGKRVWPVSEARKLYER